MRSLPAPAGAHTFAWSRLLLLGVLFHAATSRAASLDQWRERSIYQIVTDRFAPGLNSASGQFVAGEIPGCEVLNGSYCGGTWRGILENLDYIQGMNFDAIWISPVVAQLPQDTDDGRAYAGYWQQDMYSLNDYFGEAQDLHDLVDALHDRGMYFMLDVLPNHMAYKGAVDDIDYSILNPFNDIKYYHPYCPMDYSGNNLTALENCWLGSEYVPLADLDTQREDVQQMLGQWVQEIVANYSVDGLRIDAGANVNPSFFTGFVDSAGVFATAEVYLSDDSVACQWQDTVGSILNYPLYWKITSAFQEDGDVGDLVDMMASEEKTCKDTTALATFSENHDVPRFANHTQDLALAINVASFVILSDGIPVIYYGQEQHFTGGTNPYTDREPMWTTGNRYDVFSPIYQHISILNTLRRHAISVDSKHVTTQSTVIYQDSHTLAMKKGTDGKAIISILTNGGDDSSSSQVTIPSTGFSSGTQLTDLVNCATYKVSSGGSVQVTLSAGGFPAVLFPTSSLSDSSLCGASGEKFQSASQTTTVSSYSTTIAGSPTLLQITATMPLAETTQTATDAGSAANMQSGGGRTRSTPDPVGAIVAAGIVAVFAAGSFFGILARGVV